MAIAAFVVAIAALVVGAYVFRLAFKQLTALHAQTSKDMRTIMERVFILKGMEPHHANPDLYMPGGMTKDVYEEMKNHTVPAAPPDTGSDEHEYWQEMKSDLQEHLAAIGVKRQEEDQEQAKAEYEAALRADAEAAQQVMDGLQRHSGISKRPH